MNPARTEWAKQSKCISNPEPFAKNKPCKSEYDSICSNCPVIDLCLAHAVVNNERGIWGNTTEHEREELRANPNLHWENVPIEPKYQEQFLREVSQVDHAKTVEQEMIQAEQNANAEFAELRARLALNPPKPVFETSDSKALSERLSAIRNRVQGISLPKVPTEELSPGEPAPSKVLFHSS
jgi:hypothetical protein